MLSVLLVSALSLANASFQETSDNIYSCASLIDDAARLACYDSFARSPGSSESSEAPAITGTPAAGKPQAEKPARNLNPFRDFGLPERKREKQEPALMTAAVIEIRVNYLGQVTLKLENGQVWKQKGTDVRFHDGMKIDGWIAEVKKGALGSFWITVEGARLGRFKAERVI